MLAEITLLIAATLRLGTPLIFAAMGGVLSERAGIVNIGLEGMMLIGAFFGVLGSYLTGSAWIGLAFAITAGILVALLFALSTIRYGADQVISGIAINLIALGGTGYLLVRIYGSPGTTPTVTGFSTTPIPVLQNIPLIGSGLFGQSWFVWMAVLCAVVIWFFLSRTSTGLRLRASGEDPHVLEASGVAVLPIRYCAVAASGMLCGLGGAYLSLSSLNSFSESMTAGRGFIALAAVIFGGWRPLRVLGAAIFFGFASALLIRVPQNVLDPQVLFTIPYVLTIIALVVFGRSSKSPASEGVPYRPGSERI
ncbi:MAG: ABC transporter permease [Candidatus Nanopelagicaceae bacterium]|nr:ABC transporter permease [Candidatus Nanopelagicaceae bacterium]